MTSIMPQNATHALRIFGIALGIQVAWAFSSAWAFGSAWGAADELASPRPYWIWSPEQMQEQIPQGVCYFRKTLLLPASRKGQLQVAADDAFEAFVNGKSVGSGEGWKTFHTLDISPHLRKGKNTIGIKVTNRDGATAGLAAVVTLTPNEGRLRHFVTNPTWKTNLGALPLWNTSRYSDRRWQAARSLGRHGLTKPWIVKDESPPAPDTRTAQTGAASKPAAGTTKIAAANLETDPPTIPELPAPTAQQPGIPMPTEQASVPTPTRQSQSPAEARQSTSTSDPPPDALAANPVPATDYPKFRVPAGFRMEHVVGGDETGSLLAMTFTEFGQILASQENGPLLLVYDTNDNDTPDAVISCCAEVTNCQGILSISGRVFVVGEGPDGAGIYRLEDTDRNGIYEEIIPLVGFAGPMGQFGPHGMVLGPDGMIYVVVGNQTRLKKPYALSSPLRNYYEGDLVSPRYEDPHGDDQQARAPGGAVLRLDQDGSNVELVAGGLRNAYDLAFDRQGELFVYDSDAEANAGLPWYHPTRLLHIVPAGEYGWRSGWARWPDYVLDTLPAALATGQGSPTGLVAYSHRKFPPRYHDVLFSADWATGRISAIRLRRQGVTFEAQNEPFLEGQPLSVTDIDVGPNGWLYFCTGGRGARGDIFRVVWTGQNTEEVPDEPTITLAVRQPQMQSAWARQAVSTTRRALGDDWDDQIQQLVRDAKWSAADRVRGMELMHLVGPPPSDKLLEELSRDAEPLVRARAANLMGLIGNKATVQRLKEMLRDDDPYVRRHVCESLARGMQTAPFEDLQQILVSQDRFEAWSARRLLENDESGQWYARVLATKDQRLFVQGATAILTAAPSETRAKQIVGRVGGHARGFINDANFIDMLRVMQLAILRGELAIDSLELTKKWLSEEYPTESRQINRELVRLLVHLQAADVADRYLAFLAAEQKDVEKIHLATHLSLLKVGWTAEQKLELMKYFETARQLKISRNAKSYLTSASRRFAATLSPAEHRLVLAEASSNPAAALDVLFAMPEQVDETTVEQLAKLYPQLATSSGKAYERLRVGIIAVLASSQNSDAMSHLRDIYDRDPARRPAVAMGLAQQPDGRNWDYLIRSIPLLDGEPAREVLMKLQTVKYAPESPEHLRQVIVCGLRLRDQGGLEAAKLLEHWTNSRPYEEEATWRTALAAWQDWYHKEHPGDSRQADAMATTEDLTATREAQSAGSDDRPLH